MSPRTLVALALCACASPAGAANGSSEAEPDAALAVPARQEARHHLVYSNAYAHVLDVAVASGDTTDYHVHAYYTVGVALEAARTWSQYAHRERLPIAAPGPVPRAMDNWSEVLPYTHRVGNVDTVGFH